MGVRLSQNQIYGCHGRKMVEILKFEYLIIFMKGMKKVGVTVGCCGPHGMIVTSNQH